MAGDATATARRAAAQPRLSRDRIVDAAVLLVERDGPEALSMRRLGAELGVEAMSLYHYVAGRAELVRAVGDRMLEPLHEVALAGGWREACRRFASVLRGIAVAQPATFRLAGLEPLDTPMSLRAVERFLAVLVAAGFSARDGLAVYRAVAAYARGYALAEATGFTVDAARPTGRKRLSALSTYKFPVLAGCVDEPADLSADDGFELGLSALLDGLRSPG